MPNKFKFSFVLSYYYPGEKMMLSRSQCEWKKAKDSDAIHCLFDNWHMSVVESRKGYFWRIRRKNSDIDIAKAEDSYATQLEAVEAVEAELRKLLTPDQLEEFDNPLSMALRRHL